MAKYPELTGAPKQCLDTSPLTVDPIKIRAPYGNTDRAVVEQESLIGIDWEHVDGRSAWELFNSLLSGKDQDAIRGIGWESGAEMMSGERMMALADDIIAKKNTYVANARPKIVSLAEAAKKELGSISSIYKAWDDIGWAAKSGGFVRLWLKASNEEIKSQLKDDHGEIWPSQRTDARKKIRKSWDKALHLLWCALYGANQSNVYLQNKKMGSSVGATLAAAPTQVGVKGAKVVPIPSAAEPKEFIPGGVAGGAGEGIPPEEEEIPEGEPKKKSNTGLLILGAAAVALLAMKK